MTPDRSRPEIDHTDPAPPYEQLRRHYATLIEDGGVAPGERLPPVRGLAGELGLAIGTVARAYRELEAAGLVVARRGGGTRVTGAPARRGGEEHALHRAAEEYIGRARATGADRWAILDAIHRALDAPADS